MWCRTAVAIGTLAVEVERVQQAGVGEAVQRTVDGGQADVPDGAGEFGVYFLGGEQAGSSDQQAQDGAALCGGRQAREAQGRERIEGRGHGGSVAYAEVHAASGEPEQVGAMAQPLLVRRVEEAGPDLDVGGGEQTGRL